MLPSGHSCHFKKQYMQYVCNRVAHFSKILFKIVIHYKIKIFLSKTSKNYEIFKEFPHLMIASFDTYVWFGTFFSFNLFLFLNFSVLWVLFYQELGINSVVFSFFEYTLFNKYSIWSFCPMNFFLL